ncbi:MAG: hypothetical protein GX455_06060, partial [Phycisphaerae bacterium]|nr:hypothetical protein [Phycisphaerae bacterium]
MMERYGISLATIVFLMGSTVFAAGGIVAEWDFTKGTQGWSGNGQVQPVVSTPEGLRVISTGEDPWIEGPAIDIPSPDGMARVTIRMKSEADRGGELFYGPHFSAERSVRFTVHNDGNWHEYVLTIPHPLGAKTRFRLDPCTTAGELTVAWIRVEAIKKIEPPVFEKPEFATFEDSGTFDAKSGDLALRYSPLAWGDFEITIDGKPFARGYSSEQIGVIIDDQVQWLRLRNAAVQFDAAKKVIRAVGEGKDKGGCTWRLTRLFGIGEKGTLSVEVTLQTDQDRQTVLIPWLTMFAGVGTFGEKKNQGLFAGLEYLQDEPSSSEADIAAPLNVRRVPDSYKVTFPLMVIQNDGRYVGLIWERDPMVAAGFDSPDRVFGSGGHAMWLSGPGISAGRFENELCAHSPITISANKPITVKATIIGGKGDTVIPAVQQYVALRGWPRLPQFEGGFDAAVDLLSHGWLDSKIVNNGLYRHAVWGNSFGPTAAADAAMFQKWLAETTTDAVLRERLTAGSKLALEKLSPSDTFGSGVSHVRFPTGPLVFGRVPEYVRQRVAHARAELKQFDADGKIIYKPAGGVDYGRTHFENHANGIGGALIADILEAATLCPEPGLVAEALKVLDQQTKLYAGTIPRGAQTWECPLHTPDILAAAHMVKSYTLGYMLSGRIEHLEQARYWAWTGVPFVYLSNPTEGQIGEYATIAVLCATNWRAPVWFGQPVQWCGLVYGSALYQLAGVDPAGPWLKLAQGITIAGLQESWPTTDTDRQGLLPDFFLLNDQVSDGPAINPGTVGAHLPDA